MILFDKTKESLDDFVKNFVRGNVHFAEDLDEKLESLDEDLD